MLSSSFSPTCSHNMVNFGSLAALYPLASLGHPCKFQRVSRLGNVTARHSSRGRQPNFASLNRGRHLCSAGRPSRWALAHISSISVSFVQTSSKLRLTTQCRLSLYADHVDITTLKTACEFRRRSAPHSRKTVDQMCWQLWNQF